MGRFGVPELIILAVMGVAWIVPLVAVLWALVTLRQLRLNTDAMRQTLERIEQQLRAR